LAALAGTLASAAGAAFVFRAAVAVGVFGSVVAFFTVVFFSEAGVVSFFVAIKITP
jgi:hypothetical protein